MDIHERWVDNDGIPKALRRKLIVANNEASHCWSIHRTNVEKIRWMKTRIEVLEMFVIVIDVTANGFRTVDYYLPRLQKFKNWR